MTQHIQHGPAVREDPGQAPPAAGGKSEPPPRPWSVSDFLLASALTFIAGFLDAVGYVELSHLYVSFMSGNTTHLGMAMADGEWDAVAVAFGVIAAFVGGSATGTVVADRARRSSVFVLGGELAVLALALALAVGGDTVAAFILVTFVMGMQNVLHHMVAGADVGKSFITGALFSFGQALARLGHGRPSLLQMASNGFSWFSFFVGVIGGALTLTAIGVVYSLVVVLLFVTVLFALALTGFFS